MGHNRIYKVTMEFLVFPDEAIAKRLKYSGGGRGSAIGERKQATGR